MRRMLWACFLVLFSLPSQAERVKDLASVAGVRDNQLLGYGLVVGLDGSGDSLTRTRFTAHSLSALLNRYGITLPEGAPRITLYTLTPQRNIHIDVHVMLSQR